MYHSLWHSFINTKWCILLYTIPLVFFVASSNIASKQMKTGVSKSNIAVTMGKSWFTVTKLGFQMKIKIQSLKHAKITALHAQLHSRISWLYLIFYLACIQVFSAIIVKNAIAEIWHILANEVDLSSQVNSHLEFLKN